MRGPSSFSRSLFNAGLDHSAERDNYRQQSLSGTPRQRQPIQPPLVWPQTYPESRIDGRQLTELTDDKRGGGPILKAVIGQNSVWWFATGWTPVTVQSTRRLCSKDFPIKSTARIKARRRGRNCAADERTVWNRVTSPGGAFVAMMKTTNPAWKSHDASSPQLEATESATRSGPTKPSLCNSHRNPVTPRITCRRVGRRITRASLTGGRDKLREETLARQKRWIRE